MTGTAKEYADALLMLAKDDGKEQVFADALTLVADVFRENPAYLDLLASPVISKDTRKDLLRQAFGETLPQEIAACIALMCDNGHIREFAAMQETYMEQFHILSQITVATITSAAALSDDEKDALLQQISVSTGHTVRATFMVDPSLIGGVKVEMDGCILDGTIKHRLRELKEVMNG